MSEEIELMQYAVQREYARYFRLAEIPIENIYRVTTVLDVPVPDGIMAYVANTILHTPMGPPSIVADYAFRVKDEIHVVLHTELHVPGMTPAEMIQLSLEAILEAEQARQQVPKIFPERGSNDSP